MGIIKGGLGAIQCSVHRAYPSRVMHGMHGICTTCIFMNALHCLTTPYIVRACPRVSENRAFADARIVIEMHGFFGRYLLITGMAPTTRAREATGGELGAAPSARDGAGLRWLFVASPGPFARAGRDAGVIRLKRESRICSARQVHASGESTPFCPLARLTVCPEPPGLSAGRALRLCIRAPPGRHGAGDVHVAAMDDRQGGG